MHLEARHMAEQHPMAVQRAFWRAGRAGCVDHHGRIVRPAVHGLEGAGMPAAEFKAQSGTKKVAGKTMDRLKALIWLAAQDVKAELAGKETYEYQKLAELVGVTPKNWSETFTDRWVEMKRIFLRMDSGALKQVTRSRSQQKATNFASSLAKLD